MTRTSSYIPNAPHSARRNAKVAYCFDKAGTESPIAIVRMFALEESGNFCIFELEMALPNPG